MSGESATTRAATEVDESSAVDSLAAESIMASESVGADPDIAGQRWRDAAARLEYAERHGAAPEEVERLADAVIEARVAMFQAGVSSGWQLPEFLQTALERDRQLLRAWPGGFDDAMRDLPPT